MSVYRDVYEDFSIEVSEILDLSALPPHFHILVSTFVGCFTLQFLSRLICPILFPTIYPKLKPKTQRDWDIRVVSWIHSLWATPTAFWLLATRKSVWDDKIFAYDEAFGDAFGVASGYFLWDFLVSVWNVRRDGLGFVVHGIGCFGVFLWCFKPFVMYFGGVFLLWETSTIFLNIHWWLDKAGMTGTRPQFINGIILISTFFFFRIVLGIYQSFIFFHATNAAKDRIPDAVRIGYQIANVTMNSLNVFWFTKMIAALRKRFTQPPPIALTSDSETEYKVTKGKKLQ